MNQTLIGVYFAQDKLIMTALDNGSEEMRRPIKVPAIDDGLKSIYQAARLIAETYRNDNVVGICLAVPSTLRILEKGEAYGEIGSGIGPRNWLAMNVVDEFKAALNRVGSPVDQAECKFPIISQVGATALGDLKLRHPVAFDEGADEYLAERRRIGNVIHIVADHGIGCALSQRCNLFHGFAVPNIGHMLVRPLDGNVHKACRHHPGRSCLNSMASLGAIRERWGLSAAEFIECNDLKILAEIAHYLAQAIANLVYFSSPNRIVIGGRVADNPHMLPLISELLRKQMGDGEGTIPEPFDRVVRNADYIAHQKERDAGVLGACLLAEKWTRPDSIANAAIMPKNR